jgi:hypothetical protein
MTTLKWKRTEKGYQSTCGRYEIEKFASIMRGSNAWWELTGAAGTHMRKTLRVVKRMAQVHAKVCP